MSVPVAIATILGISHQQNHHKKPSIHHDFTTIFALKNYVRECQTPETGYRKTRTTIK
jgi:hypothetical protein